jgi:hypothetical protein
MARASTAGDALDRSRGADCGACDASGEPGALMCVLDDGVRWKLSLRRFSRTPMVRADEGASWTPRSLS